MDPTDDPGGNLILVGSLLVICAWTLAGRQPRALNDPNGGGRPGLPPALIRPLTAAGVALVAALLLPVPVGLLLGGGAAVFCYRFWHLLSPDPGEVERQELQRHAPLALRMAVMGLLAGRDISASVSLAAEFMPVGPCRSRLARTSSLLQMGAPAAQAWAWTQGMSPWDDVGSVCMRSERNGVPVAPLLGDLLAQVRREERGRARTRAKSVGVKTVLPLGLCFLPAFVLISVVPIVAGLMEQIRG